MPIPLPWEQGCPGCPLLLQGPRWELPWHRPGAVVPVGPCQGLEQPSAMGSGEGGRSLVVQGLIIEIDSPLCHASIPARVHSSSLRPGDSAWHARTRVCGAHSVGQGWGFGGQPQAPGRGRGQVAGVCFGVWRGGERVQVSAGCCVHGGAQRGSRCQYFISSHAGEEAEGGCRLAACFGEAQGAAEWGLSNVRMGGGRLLCCLPAPGGGLGSAPVVSQACSWLSTRC